MDSAPSGTIVSGGNLPSPLARSQVAPLQFSHRCMWGIAARWPLFYRTLKQHHAPLLRAVSRKYRRRLTRSAIRASSFIYMLSLVLKKPFDVRNAVLTGLLAALFDDLFDCQWESPESILRLTHSPDQTTGTTPEGTAFRELYLGLRSRLTPWQRTQLQQTVEQLALSETRLLRGEATPKHWEERGTAAFLVFLTVLGVAEEACDPPTLRCFGEYLQILDDFEDFTDDLPETNYFRSYPATDVDAHYLHQVAPRLQELFLPEGQGGPPFDLRLFSEFIATYHVFVVDLYSSHRPCKKAPSAQPGDWQTRPLAGADLAIASSGWLRPLWHLSAAFTAIWPRAVPTRARLAVTRFILRCLQHIIPFSP